MSTQRERFEQILRQVVAPDYIEDVLSIEGDGYAEYGTVLAWDVFQMAEKLSTEKVDNPVETSPLTSATRDVLAERVRQMEIEWWTPERDDLHTSGELAEAAAAYASEAARSFGGLPGSWPWALEWWKPTTPRRNLVKAGALILAEIERLDRAVSATASDKEDL
ncbi:hypothetical protein [Paraburkholderia largidicola]|uniref:Uncharacterized protein n=1 Tax=Paraburkholderia largidicola TaxID=3014751 RepID=A0A7I8BJ26_9BURK|nr:hypothetical protein [Paraburkholderia sp. PGU16]BCF88724.1 hypothetical protein PPGU16_17910 [Paraburkholderia sp. PGU16]